MIGTKLLSTVTTSNTMNDAMLEGLVSSLTYHNEPFGLVTRYDEIEVKKIVPTEHF